MMEVERGVQAWMRKLIAADDGTRGAQSNGSGGEDTPCPGEPAGEIGGETGISLGCQLIRPLIDSGSASTYRINNVF